MFSKSKIHEPGPKAGSEAEKPKMPDTTAPKSSTELMPATTPNPKPAPSILSSDLTIKGNLKTSGDIQVEGTVEGDIRAHLLTVGEGATIKGEIIADDVVVNGRVVGRVRGLKVRLTSSARVEGDIIHKTIAIESGAHFEGSVQRQDDPISGGSKAALAAPAGSGSSSSTSSSSSSSSRSSELAKS